MSSNLRRLSLVGLMGLFLSGLLSPVAGQPTAEGAEGGWRQLDTKSCPVIKLSEYRPGQAFCRRKIKPGTEGLGILDLTTGQVQPVPYISDSIVVLLYEDAATGYILALTADGRVRRLDAAFRNYRTVWEGPNDYISSSIVRSGGYGSGVLFMRLTDFSLWLSSHDNGLTWQASFPGIDESADATIYDLRFTASDPTVAYGLSRTVKETRPGGGYNYYNYVYKSVDAGRTFNRIYQTPPFSSQSGSLPFSYSLNVPTSPASDADQVYLYRTYLEANVEVRTYYRSKDGGQSFQEMGFPGGKGVTGNAVYLAPDGAVIQAGSFQCYADNSCSSGHPAKRSTDGGASFVSMATLPDYSLQYFSFPAQASHTYYALARQPGHAQADPTQPLPPHLVRSTDNGLSWQTLPDPPGLDLKNLYSLPLLATDYSPLTLVLVAGNGDTTYVLADPAADRSQTNSVTAYPRQDYYTQTRHNLGLFKDYWNSHGSLARFGYPQTELFREVNPSDGHIYNVQYFERNRFEYHPEYKGTPYEVLLGLLGNQLTADRRAKGDGAFNAFEDMHYPGGAYFPLTGHNLRNSFRTYWEQNGGLALYGYPISEEFYEVNPDDGQTYVVQYFERNRFEYHPENKGSEYEVLLGLLGNTLLKQKGWL